MSFISKLFEFSKVNIDESLLTKPIYPCTPKISERPRRIARFSSESHLFISAQKIINSAQIEQDQQFFLSQEFILSQLTIMQKFYPGTSFFF